MTEQLDTQQDGLNEPLTDEALDRLSPTGWTGACPSKSGAPDVTERE